MRMARGILDAMARAELDAMVEELGQRYRAGAAERLARADPGWRCALDAAEREVGALLRTLGDADAALAEWPHAVRRLGALWARAAEAPGSDAPPWEAEAPEGRLVPDVA